jgi:hypothetical protein
MIESQLFSKIKYNVFALPSTKSVLSEFPELKKIPEFSPIGKIRLDDSDEEVEITPFGGINPDKVLRYIILLFDKNTPLTEIQNINQRMSEAAEIAGIKRTQSSDNWPHKVVKMFRCEYTDINSAILAYCRLQHSSKWTLYTTLTLKHYRDQEQMLAGTAEKPITTKELVGDATIIDDLRNQFLNKIENEKLSEAVEEYTLQTLELRPEQVAENISNGKKVVPTEPY